MCGQEKAGKDFRIQLQKRPFKADYIRISTTCKDCLQGKKKESARERLHTLRKRAAANGMEISIDLDFLLSILARPCEYCGSYLNIQVDRFNNNLGYTRENCKPACRRCNMMKSDLSREAWAVIAPAVRQARSAGFINS